MNTTAASATSFSTEYPWHAPRSRCTSSRDPQRYSIKHYILATESPLNSDDDHDSVLSIQAKETDYVRDTSDTGSCGGSSDDDWAKETLEYEPATEPEDEEPPMNAEDTSEDTENEIISTKVISIGLVDEAVFADSEQSDAPSDPELGLYDYWKCAQCRNPNNNPLYRYCEKCFKVRKNFFPPRPKRKSRQSTKEPIIDIKTTPLAKLSPSHIRSVTHTDSGFDSAYNSQEYNSQEITSHISYNIGGMAVPNAETETKENVNSYLGDIPNVILGRKRNAKCDDLDTPSKRRRCSTSSSASSDSEADSEKTSSRKFQVKRITKTLSDPLLTIHSLAPSNEDRQISSENESRAKPISKRAIINSLKEKLENSGENNMCIVCCNEPKSGVFVHGRIAHICCCYKCAVKVWAKAKRCPVCNCKVSNVLKAVVM